MIARLLSLSAGALRAAPAALCLGAMLASAQLVGPNLNVSRMSADKTEPAIAIDPTNPGRMFIAANVQDGNGLFAAFTADGGATWNYLDPSDHVIADGTDGLPESCCDASVSAAADRYGNIFLVYQKTAFPSGVVVAVSTNGGHNFYHLTTLGLEHSISQPTVATGCDGPACIDSAVWITYTDSTLPGTRVVAQGARVTGLGAVLPFSATQEVQDSGGGNFGDLAIGPDGQVLVAYQTTGTNNGPSLLYTAVDPDGLGFDGFDPPVLATVTLVGDMEAIPAQPIHGIDAAAGLAYDRASGSPHRGRAYLVYVDETSGTPNNTDVFLRYSDNDGASWSAPVRVNNDATARSQFLPRIASDPVTGFAAIAWFDARHDSGDGSSADRTPGPNNDVQLYAAATLDGGANWSPNLRVSEGVSAQSASMNWNNFGEYLAIAFQSGSVFPVWPDNSNVTGDCPDGATSTEIFTASVAVGGSAMFRVWDAVLSTENCQPANGVLDPGELVTVDIALQNTGSGDVFNLEATLLPTGGVLNPDGAQGYGYIGAGDPEVARPFAFTVNAACGDTITLTLELRDGAASFGTVTFPIRVGELLTNGVSFTNTAPISIEDDAQAAPYPSVITVSGVTDPVTNVMVTLRQFIHTYPADVDVLLVGPAGQAVMLMSDAGGGHNVNITMTFADGGATLPQTQSLQPIRYAPGNLADPLDPSDPLPFPAPEGPYSASLAAFNGADPNGDWKLYVFDDQGGDLGEIAQGWSLNFVSARAVCCDPPPRLTITASGGQVRVAWPASAPGFILEGRASLGDGGMWMEVEEPVVVEGGLNTVTLSAAAPTRFFRLRK